MDGADRAPRPARRHHPTPSLALTAWRSIVAAGVEPEPGAAAALEAARDQLPAATLFAAYVPGDPLWPRILDKEEAIDAARHGLVALRTVEPGLLLVRGEVGAGSFLDVARALTAGRGYLVPGARATRTGPPPRVPWVRSLLAPFWRPEERLWQLFMTGRRHAGRAGRSAAIRPR